MNTPVAYPGVSGSVSWRRLRPAIAVAVVTALLLVSGCTPKSAAHSTAKSNANPNPNVPVPNPGAGPDAATVAPAAADPGGTASKAAQTLAGQVKLGGAGAQAALRTALTRGGVTLTEVDGTVVTKGAEPSLGISIPIGQILFVASENNYDHGDSTDRVASMINALAKDKIDESKLRAAIADDLRNQAESPTRSTAKTQQFLSEFILALGRVADPESGLDAAEDEDVPLTGLQTWLIWLSFAGGAYEHAVNAARKTSGAVYQPDHAQAGHLSTVDDPPCSSFNGSAGDATSVAASAATGGVPFSSWDGTTGMVPPANPGATLGLTEYLALANIALSLIHLVLEGLALTATGGLDPTPIERTKGIAPAHGAQGTVHVTLKYKLPVGQYANCLRLQLNASGLDFSLPNDGPLKGAEVEWEMYDDPAGVTNNPAQFYALGSGGNAVVMKTDDDGTAKTGLEGRPQKTVIPSNTPSMIRTVHLLVGVSLKSDTVLGDALDAMSAFLGGAAAPITILVNLVERSKTFSVKMSVKVKDFPPDFQIRSHFHYTGGAKGIVTATKCGGVPGVWTLSADGESYSITLGSDWTGTLPDGFGGTYVVKFVEGDPDQLQWRSEIAVQSVDVIPGSFCDK